MDPAATATETHDLMRDSLRRFLGEKAGIASFVRPLFEDARGTTAEVWRGLAELGALGLLLPLDVGGSGLGAIAAGIACEEFGRALFPGPFLSSAVVASALLAQLPLDAFDEQLASALAGGGLVATLAVLEPARASAWRQPQTRALEKSAGFTITGEKIHVAFAEASDVLLVLASVEDRPGDSSPALFAIDRSACGLEIEPLASLDPSRRPACLRLKDAPGRRVSPAVEGPALLSALACTLDLAAAATIADGVGAAQRAFELALDWAQQRRQFDRSIGSFQSVQHLLVDALTELSLLRAIADEALSACDGSSDDARTQAVAVAKAAAARTLPEIGAIVIQIFGGIGFTWEHDAHLFYRRLIGASLSFGDEAQSLDRVAALLFPEHAEPGG